MCSQSKQLKSADVIPHKPLRHPTGTLQALYRHPQAPLRHPILN